LIGPGDGGPSFQRYALRRKGEIIDLHRGIVGPGECHTRVVPVVQSSRLGATAGSDQIAVQVKGVLHATSPSIPHWTKENMKWRVSLLPSA
jgi:hypothetical protein